MSKVARTIAIIAAVVAIAATGIGLVLGPAAFAATFGASASTIAAIAGAVSAAASMVAQATAKPPDMQGTVSQVLIGNNLPIAYALGVTLLGGALIYDDSNGGDNQWRYQVMVVSAGGPIQEKLGFFADYNEITNSAEFSGDGVNGWYEDWLFTQFRLGATPDTAFTGTGPHSLPNWTTDHKLSGYAAYRVQMKFDKEGEKFASGIPQFGMLAKWTKTYDPRQDSTYPGGSGAQRFDDEDTWSFGTAGVGTVAPGQNPALKALDYARGRFQNGVRVVGVGLSKEAIRVEDFVELANICDANGWTVGGAVYEAPGRSKWDNLKSILQAAAAEPVWSGGMLSLRFQSPKTPVFTITADDLADGDIEVVAMKGWRDRINTVVPRARLSTHKWEYEQLEAVTDATYVTEDGETKTTEIQFDLAGSDDADATADQAAQLAAYAVANGRELGPWRIPLKPAFMVYRPGEAGNVDLASILGDASLGVQGCVITGRQVDPQTGMVTLTLETETTAKHAWALGQTGVAPPTPTIIDPQALDEAVSSPGYDEVPADAATITLVEWTDRLVMRTSPIARAQTYRWRFYLSDGTTLRREIITTIPQVEYTKAQAHADGVVRSYKVEVAAVNTAGTGTALMSATQTKTAPAAPSSVAFADGTSTSEVTFTPPGSGEIAGYRLSWSTVSGFNAMTQGSTMLAGSSPSYTPQLPATTYYGKVATYDLWSSQPDQINFSAEDSFVITPGGGGDPPAGGGGGGFEGGGGGGGGHLP